MVEQSVSFGCKSSVNLDFDAEQVLHHHMPHTDLQRYCADLVISLENIIKSASTSVKEIISKIPHSSARYTMCYCPIWQDPIWYEISTDRELRCSHHQMWLIRFLLLTALMQASGWSHPPRSESSLDEGGMKSDVSRMQKRTRRDWCQHR